MKVFSLAVFCVLVAVSSASVLKPGTKAALHHSELFSPAGISFQKAYFFQVIFPGTKWCGDGDIADNYDDLGWFAATDYCCRDHDHCDDNIVAGETKHGLTNDGSYTRSHCKCDLQFFDCLEKSKSSVSGVVATGYFNFLGGMCFDLRPPATCVEWDGIIGLRQRCVKYEYDETKPDEWQWFDVPRWLFGPNYLAQN